ncbi:MAG: UvrD-helicase domain-containing protein [Bacteroidaceae bacterium]|nr:UvrD-helicase domain-containing protein [Bacteroidaceae bacterium]
MKLFIGVFILIVCIVVGQSLYYYANKKTRLLKEKGYLYVCYFLTKVDKLDYYRNPAQWITSLYDETYQELCLCKNKWYVRWSGGDIIIQLIEFYEAVGKLTQSFSPFFSLSHYFASSEYQQLKPVLIQAYDITQKTVDYDLQEWVMDRTTKRGEGDNSRTDEIIQFLAYERAIASYDRAFRLDLIRPKHNNEFVIKELADNKDFFDKVLQYPLDQQQRESIVKLEDNCLVISSAGSGKTSTSIAKVKYLLEKRHIPKEEILVLSYNRKTADEFQERLDVTGLTCKTFHALALSIIGKAEGVRPDVCEAEFLLQCFYVLVRKSDDYKEAITKYIGEIASITKNEYEYDEAEPYYKDRETYGIMAPYGDMNGSPVFTRSEQEKKICTWLTTHGVDFLYEQPYPIETANQQYRQYKPDFTIYYTLNGRRYYLFLEHFGIDMNGNVPVWFGEGKRGGFTEANRVYKEGIRWKRQIHNDNKTLLIETTSAMFQDGSIYRQLERQLNQAGVQIRELTPEEKFKLLFERNEVMEGNVMNLFTSFISLMKSNRKTFDSIMKTIKDSEQGKDFNERCRFLMYEVIKPLYDEYESSLKAKGQMDFTDLILHATELCDSQKYRTPYSYILVDEFQDISVDRYEFLKSLRKDSPLTKMYCVGDDWQSIYRFSGSDINLFNGYSKYFGFTEKCKIETSYRFGNPLIDRSSKFILKNPCQVKKTVKPYYKKDINPFTKKPALIANSTKLSFIPFERGYQNSEYLEEVKKIIINIPKEESIMLLGRYNSEVKIFPRNCIEEAPNSKRAIVTYAGRTMIFMSVHASKGLESDHVIILNCSQDGGGFPSRVSDDPILGYVLSEIDTFEYSEERRLFYVAITRAKKHTYVMYNNGMPSVFVTELLEEESDQLICPVCKKGRLKVIKESVADNGTQYRNYLCSNAVSGCKYFWRVYFDEEDEVTEKYHEQMDRFFKPKDSPQS